MVQGKTFSLQEANKSKVHEGNNTALRKMEPNYSVMTYTCTVVDILHNGIIHSDQTSNVKSLDGLKGKKHIKRTSLL